MCGRFTLTVDPADLQLMLELGEVPPTCSRATTSRRRSRWRWLLRQKNRKVELFQWGLIPSWSKDPSMGSRMINARAETLHEKPAYRVPFARKRCLILADGFFEWKALDKGKQPYFIQLQSREPFAFAGLWDHWTSPEGDERRTCSIVTCEPNAADGRDPQSDAGDSRSVNDVGVARSGGKPGRAASAARAVCRSDEGLSGFQTGQQAGQ